MVEIKNLDLFYPGGYQGLKKVDISIKKGECVLLCGESGSGKSTLINLINGIATRYDNCTYTGGVLIDSKDTKDMELYQISKEISSVFQNPKTHFFNVDTTTELLFYLENRGFSKKEMDERMEEMISLFHIKHLLNRNIFNLSGGEKQILSIASSYISGNSIIVLDEPSSSLDSQYIDIIADMLKTLKKRGVTLIIAEHRLYYLREIVDSIIFLKNGKITQRFSREEFFSIDKEKLKKMGLRSVNKEKLKMKNTRFDKGSFVIESLYCRFKGQNQAIKTQNLKFCIGSIIGIIGRNGVGKSTFIRSLIGVQKKAKVQRIFQNKRILNKDSVRLSNFVMQDVNHQLFTDSILEEVTLGHKEIDEKKVEFVLQSLGLWEFRGAHPMSLSGGQKQRVAIANVLLSSGKIVCFDEPTSGMDYKNMIQISQLIQNTVGKDNIVFIVSHDNEFLNHTADYVLNLEEYRIQ